MDGQGATPPPAWHWIPLGMCSCIAASALLARWSWLPYAQAKLQGFGPHPTALQLASVQSSLALTGALVVIAGMVVGGTVVGIAGSDQTNPRHGMLAGLCSMILLGLLGGARLTGVAVIGAFLMVPIGALAAFLGAVLGLRIRVALRARGMT